MPRMPAGALVTAVASGTDAISLSSLSNSRFRLLSVQTHFSAAPTAPEDWTVTVNDVNGAAYDTVIARVTPSTDATVDILYQPDHDMYLDSGTAIDVAFPNSGGRTHGTKIVIEVF